MRNVMALLAAILSVSQIGTSQPGIGRLQISTLCAGGPVTATAVTSEELLATCTVAAKAVNPGDMIVVQTWWTTTNSAGQKAVRVRLGSNAQANPPWVGGANISSQNLTTHQSSILLAHVIVRTSTSQLGAGAIQPSGYGSSSGALSQYTIDLNVAQPLSFSCQKANGADLCRLEYYTVQFHRQ
jgi:hypothetical protein